MKIRTVNFNNMGISNNTPYNRKKLEIIQNMINNGCQIITECERPNACIYLGYINKYVPLANYAAKVCEDGSYTEKYTRGMYSPLPSSMKTFYLRKVKYDKDGNTDSLERTIKIKNGKLVFKDETKETKKNKQITTR